MPTTRPLSLSDLDLDGPMVHIARETYYPKSVMGSARVLNAGLTLFQGVSMELPWDGNKQGTSCVFADTYLAIWTHSPKLERETWELMDVQGRKYIRAHAAAIAVEHLRGCIAIGLKVADINKDGSLDLLESRGKGQKMFDEISLDLAGTYKHNGKDVKAIRWRISGAADGRDKAPDRIPSVGNA